VANEVYFSSSRRRHTRSKRDWSSDVCSSDLLKEPEEAKKHIGYLPELPPLYMDMTVREYLEFAAELKKIPKKKREDSVTEVEKRSEERRVGKERRRRGGRGGRRGQRHRGGRA